MHPDPAVTDAQAAVSGAETAKAALSAMEAVDRAWTNALSVRDLALEGEASQTASALQAASAEVRAQAAARAVAHAKAELERVDLEVQTMADVEAAAFTKPGQKITIQYGSTPATVTTVSPGNTPKGPEKKKQTWALSAAYVVGFETSSVDSRPNSSRRTDLANGRSHCLKPSSGPASVTARMAWLG